MKTLFFVFSIILQQADQFRFKATKKQPPQMILGEYNTNMTSSPNMIRNAYNNIEYYNLVDANTENLAKKLVERGQQINILYEQAQKFAMQAQEYTLQAQQLGKQLYELVSKAEIARQKFFAMIGEANRVMVSLNQQTSNIQQK